MNNKTVVNEEIREEVMRALAEAGIPMKKGAKKPAHGIFSGIVESRDEKLIVRIPSESSGWDLL